MLTFSPRQLEMRRKANANVIALKNGSRARIEAEQAAARREAEREREKQLAKQERDHRNGLDLRIRKLAAEIAEWDACEEDLRRDNPPEVVDGMLEDLECQRTRAIEKKVKLEDELARLDW